MEGSSRSYLAAVAGTLMAASASAQPLWGQQFGTFLGEGVGTLAPDGSGGVFVAGPTLGSLGGPNANLGSSDVFLGRYNSAGQQLWMRQFGTPVGDGPVAITPDGEGGVYMVGSTQGSLGGPFAGYWDVFLARYDRTGTQVWITQFGTPHLDSASVLTHDPHGGFFLAGHTELDLGGPNAGGADIYLARYDGAGNRIWLKQFGTSSLDLARGLAHDNAGGVIVGGEMSGYGFVARYNGEGNRVWLSQFGDAHTFSLAPDGAGGVFLAGSAFPIVVASRYDASGNRLWFSQFSVGIEGQVRAAVADGHGGFYIGGYGGNSLTAPPGNQVFVARYTGAGKQSWMTQFGTQYHDTGQALASDGLGGVYVGGQTLGDLYGLIAGMSDAHLARFGDQCYPDCDGDDALSLADFGCFQTKFFLADPYADCNGDSTLNLADFGCFQTKFAAGCP